MARNVKKKEEVRIYQFLPKTTSPRYIVREERICMHCNMSKIEDEFHFLLECPLYNCDRLNFVTLLQHVIIFIY